MFRMSTENVIAPAVRTFTLNDLMLTFRTANCPPAELADRYIVPTDGSADGVVAAMVKANAKPSEEAADTFDAMVDNVAYGLRSLLTTAHTVIAPILREAKSVYDELSEGMSPIPQIEVKPVVFNAIHQHDTLVSHIETYQHCPESVRTLKMDCPEIDDLIDILCQNNHVDADTVRSWTLAIGADVLREGWYWLFGERGVVDCNELMVSRKINYHRTLDSTLVAYFLTAWLCGNPRDVKGESVSLEEWEKHMTALHTLAGATLREMYIRRGRDNTKGKLILSVVNDFDCTCVYVNGDLYNEWTASGGDVSTLLGASIVGGVFHIADINERKDELTRAWERKHYSLKLKAVNQYSSARRDVVRSVIKTVERTFRKDLPEQLSADLFETRLANELNALTDQDLDDIQRSLAQLVTGIWYPGTPHRKFLAAMDRSVKLGLAKTPREAATSALMDMLSEWMVGMLATERVEISDLSRPVKANEPLEVAEQPEESEVVDEVPEESVQG